MEFLSDGLEGRSRNPIALLFDNLKNPGSDLGYNLESCLDWKYDETKEIDHLVIGKTPPGGVWNVCMIARVILNFSNLFFFIGI